VPMGEHYRHLSVRQRERLAKMFYEGQSLVEMAKALGRDKSTIWRELRRNGLPKRDLYRLCWAQELLKSRDGSSFGGHLLGLR